MITERMDPKTLVNNIVVDTKSAAQDTVALAKAEIQPAAKAAGTAGGIKVTRSRGVDMTNVEFGMASGP